MIIQGWHGGLLLFRQTDHAILSGRYAEAWGNKLFPAFGRRRATLIAAFRHDDGWAEWELAPRLNDQGRPIDFIQIPATEHVVVYRRGIDLVEAEDPYAGCVVSQHGERLYSRPFHPGMRPRIEGMTGASLDAARAYVDHELFRQDRLIGDHGLDRDELEETWRLMQVWDRLSLFVCMQPLGSGASATMPPVRATDERDEQITVRTPAADLVELNPYPFAEPEVRFEVEASFVAGERWADDASFRQAYREAERRIVSFTARSGA